jgi:hypothetical protein
MVNIRLLLFVGPFYLRDAIDDTPAAREMLGDELMMRAKLLFVNMMQMESTDESNRLA